MRYYIKEVIVLNPLLLKAIQERAINQSKRRQNEAAEFAHGAAQLAPGIGTVLGGLAGAGLGMLAGPGGALTGASTGASIGGAIGQGAGVMLDEYAQNEFDKERERQLKELARKQAVAALLGI